MADRSKVVHRLLKLIVRIQRGPPPKIRELSEFLDVSRRTVQYDIQALIDAGFPVYTHSPHGGFYIRADFFLPPLQFSFEEALAVLAMGPHGGRHPAPSALHSGLMKVANALSPSLWSTIQEALPRIRYHLRPHEEASPNHHYELLVGALQDKKAVAARYFSVREDAEFDTEIEPYAVFFHRHSWYVIGYSCRDQGTRTFKLSRFQTLERTNRRYKPPRNFDFDRSMSGAWGIITDGPGHDVKIRFRGRGVHYVKETRWHPSQRITLLPNHECRLEVTVNGFDELIPWILSWGRLVVVEEPEVLRLAIKQELEEMLAQQAVLTSRAT